MRSVAMALCGCLAVFTALDAVAKGSFDEYFSRQCPSQPTFLDPAGAIHPEAIKELQDIPKFVVEAAKSELGSKVVRGGIPSDSTTTIDNVWEISISKKTHLLFANVSYNWDKPDQHTRYKLAIAIDPKTGKHTAVKVFSECAWAGKEDYCHGEGEYSDRCVPYDVVDIKGNGEKAVILYEGERDPNYGMTLLNIAAYRAEESGWIQLGVGCTSQWD